MLKTSKKCQSEVAEINGKLEEFECNVSAQAIKIEELTAALEEAQATHAEDVEGKDSKISELEASQADFDASVAKAVAAEVAEFGETEPVKTEAKTLSYDEHMAIYNKMPAGAERAEYREKYILAN